MKPNLPSPMNAALNLNLKHLHTFVLVAEYGSFRRAADDIHRSQPAVTMQIKQLEEQLGVTLFHRTTQKVELTSAGEQLLICARRSLAELKNGLSYIRDVVDITRGHIKFSCVPTIASTHLPEILLQFQKQYPNITLQVSETASHAVLELIRNLDVDFGIGPVKEGKHEFGFQHILSEGIYALIPKKYMLVGKTEISLRKLAQLPVMGFTADAAMHEALDLALAKRGLQLQYRYEFQRNTTSVAMAVAGLGVAIVPENVLPRGTSDDLQVLPIVEPRITRQIGIITSPDRTLSPAAMALVSMIAAHFAERTR